MKKPQLIIGGASKSGTTAIYYYLRQHPSLCMSEKKELHFFARKSLERTIAGPGDRFVLAEIPKTFDEYLSFYSHCDQPRIAVDISPSYLYHYQAADEIKRYLGDVRIVFILRNPVDKAFSQYMHLVGEGLETLSFEEALTNESSRMSEGYSDMWLYRGSGLYADTLEHYRKVFGEANVRVFYYDEFIRDPSFVLREICVFTGAGGDFKFEPITDVNRSGSPKSVLVAKLIAPNMFTYVLRRMVPQGLGRIVRKMLKELNTGKKPKLSDKIRAEMTLFYEHDIRRVETLVGQKSGWLF